MGNPKLKSYGGGILSIESVTIGTVAEALVTAGATIPTAAKEIHCYPAAALHWHPTGTPAVTDLNSSRQWTLSGSGTNEYYFELSGSGDPTAVDPVSIYDDTVALNKVGSLGSLEENGWAFGDNDSLGFNTIYVRLSDSTDPDSSVMISFTNSHPIATNEMFVLTHAQQGALILSNNGSDQTLLVAYMV